MRSVLMTGVTGVLGSEIVKLLTGYEKVYFLIRKESMEKVKGMLDLNYAIIGDITQPLCGISPKDIRRLKDGGVSTILHFAADVSFSPKDINGKISLTNYTGTLNVLDVATALGVKELHYCGTAYAGTRRNPYEQSKYNAEKKVIEYCALNRIQYAIYKPSAIVGDYTSGISRGFNGYVGSSSIFHTIAKTIRRRNRMGENAIVNLPVFFVCSNHTTMNIIPVDWVAKTFFKLYQKGANGQIYYLVHDRPPKARWLIEEGFKNLGIENIRYIPAPMSQTKKDRRFGDDSVLKKYQGWADKILTQYMPYCLYEPSFGLEPVDEVLGNDFTEPPLVTPVFVKKLFDYAKEVDFEAA